MGEYETGKGVDPTLVKIIAGVLILAAAIVLIGPLFSGGADVSSSDGESADGSAGDGGSGGIVTDSDSDSSVEFTPTAEVTLSNGVVVSVRGLEIVEMPEGQNVPEENMVTGTMYTHSGSVYTGPYTRVEIATEKKKMDDISFSVSDVSVSNIRTEEFKPNKEITVYADMQISEWKKVRTHITGFSSKKELVFYTSDLDLTLDKVDKGFNILGTSISEDKWKNTELVIIRFSVQNK